MGGSLSRIASAFMMISICCWAYLEALGSRRIASILRASLSRLVRSSTASFRVNPGELCLRARLLRSFTPDPAPLDLPSSEPPISTSAATDARRERCDPDPSLDPPGVPTPSLDGPCRFEIERLSRFARRRLSCSPTVISSDVSSTPSMSASNPRSESDILPSPHSLARRGWENSIRALWSGSSF